MTPLNSGIKTLQPSLLKAGSPLTIHALTPSQTPLHTSITPLSPKPLLPYRSTYKKTLQIWSVNERRYGRSSWSSLKIPSGNLQQSLHLAPPPSAPLSVTLTFSLLLTTTPILFPTSPIPTPILTL